LWRKSIIVPIHKKEDNTNPYNFRPISHTCALCRTFERILAKYIVEFLQKKGFFSNEQFGFLKNDPLQLNYLQSWKNSIPQLKMGRKLMLSI